MIAKNEASGFQITFLIFAFLLLAVPADRYVLGHWQWAAQAALPVDRLVTFALACAVLFGVPPLRRHCARLLENPVPASKTVELALVVALDFAAGMASLGVLALWWLASGGPAELASRTGNAGDLAELQRALSLGGVVTSLFIGGLLGPFVEELVFRGLLYRAWERQWGWFAAALASSAVFAFMHPSVYVAQFLGGLILVCAYRRTGSLRASILVHAVTNVLLWYPLLGRFVLPGGRGTGAIGAWLPNLACLAIVAAALPAYLWMSRTPRHE